MELDFSLIKWLRVDHLISKNLWQGLSSSSIKQLRVDCSIGVSIIWIPWNIGIRGFCYKYDVQLIVDF